MKDSSSHYSSGIQDVVNSLNQLQYEKAISAVDKLLQTQTVDPIPLLKVKCRCFIALEDFKQVDSLLNNTGQSKQSKANREQVNRELWFERAYQLYRTGLLNEALSIISEFGGGDEDSSLKYNAVEHLKAQIYYKMGKYSEALDVYDALLSHNSDEDLLTNYLAAKTANASFGIAKGLFIDFSESRFQDYVIKTDLVDNFEYQFNLICTEVCRESVVSGQAESVRFTVMQLEKLETLASNLDKYYGTEENKQLWDTQKALLLYKLNNILDQKDEKFTESLLNEAIDLSKNVFIHKDGADKDAGKQKSFTWLELVSFNNLIVFGNALESLRKNHSQNLLLDAYKIGSDLMPMFDMYFKCHKNGKKEPNSNSQTKAIKKQEKNADTLAKLPKLFQGVILANYAILLLNLYKKGECLSFCNNIISVYGNYEFEGAGELTSNAAFFVDIINVNFLYKQKKFSKIKEFLLEKYEATFGVDAFLAENYLLLLVGVLIAASKKKEASVVYKKLDDLKFTKGLTLFLQLVDDDITELRSYLKSGILMFETILGNENQEKVGLFLKVNKITLKETKILYAKLLEEVGTLLIEKEDYAEAYLLFAKIKSLNISNLPAKCIDAKMLVAAAFAKPQDAEQELSNTKESLTKNFTTLFSGSIEEFLKVTPSHVKLTNNKVGDATRENLDRDKKNKSLEKKRLKSRAKRRQRYLNKLLVLGIMPQEKLPDPERWIAKKFRGKLKNKKKLEVAGAQGAGDQINEKEAAKFDVLKRTEQAATARGNSTAHKKAVGGATVRKR